MKQLTEKDVDFEVTCEEEDLPIQGNAQASGDEQADKEAEQWVIDQLEAGNEWAWCSVKVTARWEAPDGTPYEGTDYLGACSYKSEKDFVVGGYYADMKANALENLNHRLEKVLERAKAIQEVMP